MATAIAEMVNDAAVFSLLLSGLPLGLPDVEEGQSLISERTVESFQGGHE